jgi:adenylyltransferase/sulfurtransferase
MSTPKDTLANEASLLTEPDAQTRFVIIGAGGLGCPVSLNLLAAGAQSLLLLDGDTVDSSNLQRQVLYTVGDVGASKAEAARHQLRRRAPHANIETQNRRLEVVDIPAFVDGLGTHDIVLECTDDPAIKFALNDACVGRVRLVIGGVVGWRGQVLALSGSPGADDAACYRCIYEEAPASAATCAGVGVLGAAAGHVGALMVQLAWALACGRDVAGQLLHIDFRTLESRTLAPAARRDCPACSAQGARASA